MMDLRPSRRRKALGIGCICMGPVGLVLPILPGFIFVGLGVFVLRDQYIWAHRGIGVLERRWPHMMPAIEAREEKAMAWMDRQIDRVKGRFRRS
jgi:hypothetical protein